MSKMVKGAIINQHQLNWMNRAMWTDDNLDIMCGMNSDSA